jgi:hypothetical protein
MKRSILTAKCLSLRQPYTELIVSGSRIMELIKWNTRLKGEFLAYASKVIDKEIWKLHSIDMSSQITGAMVISDILYDVKL